MEKLFCIKKVNVFLPLSIIFFICSMFSKNMQTNVEIDYIKPNTVKDLLITQTGIASHYGTKFHKRKTASGEEFDLFAHTSAHKKLPFGTIVKVINTENNMVTLAKINDRGPFVKGRIIDLSHKAARMINGFNNPKVNIQCFDNNKILETIDSNYLLGYSIVEPFVILNKNSVNILDATDNFEGAMNSYLNIINNADTTYFLYLFAKAEKTSNKQQYFIGRKNCKDS